MLPHYTCFKMRLIKSAFLRSTGGGVLIKQMDMQRYMMVKWIPECMHELYTFLHELFLL